MPEQSKKPVGTRNRNVVNARRAIADFVESNAPRLNGWLERVADGIPKRDADGKKIVDNQGSVVYVVKPDPATALKLVGDLCEYHLPKLSRSDVAMVAKIEHSTDVSQMNARELEARLLVALGLNEGNIVDVEHVMVEAVPDAEWLK